MRAFVLCITLCGLLPMMKGDSLLQKAAAEARPKANPFGKDPNAPLAGAKLFERECSSCHGERARGNGRRHTPPLATELVRNANPGTLFWILWNGSSSHRMPSFSHLPAERRWQIISYLQTLSP